MPTAGLVVPRAARGGNRVTALRWARVLRRLGWRTTVREAWDGRPWDLLVALHARRTGPEVARFRAVRPGVPVVVAATGTDLYVDLAGGGEPAARAREGFAAAERIVVLQERAVEALPPELRDRVRVVHQSLAAGGPRPAPRTDVFEVCALAHLRPVKDPLLAARAARLLPAGSPVRVLHVGGADEERLAAEAERESRENLRWRWLGARPRREALCTLARSRLLVSTSVHEGGANAVTEALALGVGVLATDVPGTTGLLGAGHPGLFPPGDAVALAGLLQRAAEEPGFLAALEERSRERAFLADPVRELAAWRALLGELGLRAG